MILKMRQAMFRNLCVISFLIFSLLITSCQKKEKVVMNDGYISISGLLTFKDTVTNYDEVGIKKLSDYGFFKQPLHQLIPATKQVIPYEINSPLFTDYASKKRFISFPEGSSASYKNDETVLDFPSGTIIIKNFYYKNQPKPFYLTLLDFSISLLDPWIHHLLCYKHLQADSKKRYLHLSF
jgi:hypothetical protein